MATRGEINSNFYQLVNADANGNITAIKPEFLSNITSNTANYANYAGNAFNVSGSNVTGPVANATYATSAGTATTANTANVANVANSANSVSGANVSGTVANATYAATAGVANSVAVANVVGIGNIAVINLDGNAGNILYGNGVFSTVPNVSNVANANFANYAGTAYNVSAANVTGIVGNATHANIADLANSVAGANVTGTVADAVHATVAESANSVAGSNVVGYVNDAVHANVANVANLVAGSNVSGIVANASHATIADSANSVAGSNVSGIVANANYASYSSNSDSVNASISNVKITGGSTGQYLQTDGTGNLTFASVSANPGGSNSQVQYNNNGVFAGNSGFLFDTVRNEVVVPNISAGNGSSNTAYIVHSNLVTNSSKVSSQSILTIHELTLGYTGNELTTSELNLVTKIKAGDKIVITGAINDAVSLNGTYTANTISSANNIATIRTIESLPTITAGDSNVANVSVTSHRNVISYNQSTGNIAIVGDTLNVSQFTTSNLTASQLSVSGTVGSNLIPNTTLRYLGNATLPWNAFLSGIYFGGTNAYMTGNNTAKTITVASATTFIANNVNVTNALTAGRFIGEGGNLSNIIGANVTGQVGNALIAGTVYTNAQPNITSLGNLTGLTVIGNALVGNLTSIDSIGFDTANAPGTVAVGQIGWHDADGTIIIGMKGGNVTQSVGEESYIYAKNESGADLVDGQIVRITGSSGQRVTIGLAQANTEATSTNTIGMVTEPIGNNNPGFVTTSGVVNGLNTSGAVAGAMVFLSPTTPGGWTTTKPSAPNHTVVIGFVERVHATNGSIYIKVDNGYELDELHNVNISSPATGQALIYNGSNLWINGIPNNANTVVTASQPNITSVGTLLGLNVLGNIDVTGNFNVTGNLNYSNVTDLVVGDPLIYLGANNTGNLVDLGFAASYNDGNYKHTGLARNHSDGTWTFFDGVSQEPTTVIDWANATYPNVKLGNLQVTTINSTTVNGNFVGNGSGISHITAANIVGSVANANYADVSATSYSINGANVSGDVSGANHANIADVANSVAGANVTGEVAFANHANYAGNITISAQPNITSVGTLISLQVGGHITPNVSNTYSLGNATHKFKDLYLSGTTIYLDTTAISATNGNVNLGSFVVDASNGTISGANVSGDVSGANHANISDVANSVAGSNVVGDVSGANHANISDVANSVSGANVVGDVNGANHANIADQAHSVAGANVVGDVSGAGHANTADIATTAYNIDVANVAGIGNIATINLTGNGDQTLLGNGTWGAMPTTANANFANFAGEAFSVSVANIVGVVNLANYATVANTVAGSNVTGQVNYAAVANSVAGANVSGAVAYATTANSVAGSNVTGQVNYAAVANSVAGANVSGAVANASHATTAGTVTTNAQPNITSLGTLTSLSVTGVITGNTNTTSSIYVSEANNVSISNRAANTSQFNLVMTTATGGSSNTGSSSITTNNPLLVDPVLTVKYQPSTGNLTATRFVGNVTGDVTGNVSGSAGSANSVAVANVSGIGNIATVNLNGSSSQVLYGNGVWAYAGGGGGGTPGGANTQLQFNNDGAFGGISTVTWNGSNLALGAVSNVKITGGNVYDVIKTDGTGNLTFGPVVETLLVGTRTGPYTVPITNYTMTVVGRSGNITVYVN